MQRFLLVFHDPLILFLQGERKCQILSIRIQCLSDQIQPSITKLKGLKNTSAKSNLTAKKFSKSIPKPLRSYQTLPCVMFPSCCAPATMSRLPKSSATPKHQKMTAVSQWLSCVMRKLQHSLSSLFVRIPELQLSLLKKASRSGLAAMTPNRFPRVFTKPTPKKISATARP